MALIGDRRARVGWGNGEMWISNRAVSTSPFEADDWASEAGFQVNVARERR